MPSKVLLAMSGGVDSSVCARLLKDQGHEVLGVFMRTGVHSHAENAPERKKGCCSAVDAADARRVADRMDIPFYALDFEAEFGKIMDYFATEYLSGRTPNPCVVCNNWLKFGQLWTYGKKLGVDYIATGHYARVIPHTDGAQLHRAFDRQKDQTYVLHGLKQEILNHIIFPLGEMQKEEVRQLASDAGLAVANKPDSVEICFVPDQDHARMVRERMPGKSKPGVIRDTSGKILGPHDGIERFTVGQRKGLNVAAGERRYVLEILPDSAEVIVGDKEGLLAKGLAASGMNWLCNAQPGETIEGQAQIRYRHQAAQATVECLPDGEAYFRFEEPQSAITPGQAVVLYQGDRVLGGGWINEATEPA